MVAMKLIQPTPEFASLHYNDLRKKPFFGGLVNFFSSGPIVAMVWEGKGAAVGGRVLLGSTNPADSLPGTIRGDFSIDIGRNIIHGSDSAESAVTEISLWFSPNEVFAWKPSENPWIYEK
uniref:nucleoside-diphosphate kinase n=1 Tax=Arcella intermedia TaxID=1963864 RepID=A0A6B2LPQ7_9EUKA